MCRSVGVGLGCTIPWQLEFVLAYSSTYSNSDELGWNLSMLQTQSEQNGRSSNKEPCRIICGSLYAKLVFSHEEGDLEKQKEDKEDGLSRKSRVRHNGEERLKGICHESGMLSCYIDLEPSRRGFLSLQVYSKRKMTLVGRAEVKQNGEKRLEGICHEGGMLSRLEGSRMKGSEMCSKPAKI
ncbi:hypothetical protein VNO80_22852 [Phaseolus coccineus]|uniref:Uncharacterized protein n=1 Tax=Phaseolus coccineus TaxID=3886 RepID=A0AAN9M5M4_PHACN